MVVFLFFVNKGRGCGRGHGHNPYRSLKSLIIYILPVVFQGEAYCICKSEDAVIVRVTSLAHPLPVIIFPEPVHILHHLIGYQPIF